jgi:hypothetical protein
MTETNKKRVVKYGNLLRRRTDLTFEALSNYMKIDINADYVYRTSINCTIAEVEAVFDAESKYINYWNLTELQSELAELKSML